MSDFINCICELYGIDKTLVKDKITNENEVNNFLMKLGVIKDIDQISILKDILGSDFRLIVSVISQYVVLDGEIDSNLKKFMDYYRKESVLSYLDDKISPTVVDFFCGAGGMSLGFHQNNFKILIANDIENVCTKTYLFNHYEIPKDRIITGDIKEIINNIDTYIDEEVDVIIGGPPCQGFSMANRQRIIDDPRNILYKYYVEGVRKLKPKFFVMENVKGMLSVADQVIEDFHNLEDVNYDVYYHVFNAKDFGVPQNRERLIYIGIRMDISNGINKKAKDIIEEIENEIKNKSTHVLSDAIQGLRKVNALTIKNSTELDSEECGKKIEKNKSFEENEYIRIINKGKTNSLVFNHKARYNNDRDIEIFRRMIPGDNSSSERIADIMPYKSRSHVFKDKYYKLKPNEVCKTITAHMKFDCNMYIHPNQARGLTPREAARIQSYPDDYYFLGSYTKTYMQIGNSVPPLMSREIAKIIRNYLKG
ncbi:DNA cytosine methyltransferase [Clostridium botulinum]|nr:DNA cytosine methyltransferase [Clostridium botulinum]NFI53319.1 DNA cytosine methyltransferase [Clostridium botulinum]NFO39232.1 DNA cytosine methyltransferase [Clostridium botulinum]NFQ40148.1 DNA cytosine methyltransferase [Clostridium botulinum]